MVVLSLRRPFVSSMDRPCSGEGARDGDRLPDGREARRAHRLGQRGGQRVSELGKQTHKTPEFSALPLQLSPNV